VTDSPAFGRLLFLCADPQRVRAQIDGAVFTREQAGALRDDISTDEISPLPAMVNFDDALGPHAHTGFTAGGERPIARDALRRAGIGVLVGGRRYGKGSSREHSPLAERAAGVRLVIAESFERIYRQNADNLGLLTSTDLGLVDRLQRGEAPTLDELLAGRDPQAAAILRAGGLLPYGLGPVDGPEDPPLGGPRTLFDKIVDRHRLRNGFVRADLRFIHEYYTGMCAHLLARHAGEHYRLQDPQHIVCFEDHLSYVRQSPAHVAQGLVPAVQRLSQAHRAFVARHGLTDHGYAPGGEGSQGISHAMVAERYALPGQLVVGTDSHTPHSGALGCVAFGVGSTEMANAFLTGAVRMGRPEVLRIEVDGPLPAGVRPRTWRCTCWPCRRSAPARASAACSSSLAARCARWASTSARR
jgi:3-isopropylmalate/(R)-2-methylmalate dehydratase large subunit